MSSGCVCCPRAARISFFSLLTFFGPWVLAPRGGPPVHFSTIFGVSPGLQSVAGSARCNTNVESTQNRLRIHADFSQNDLGGNPKTSQNSSSIDQGIPGDHPGDPPEDLPGNPRGGPPGDPQGNPWRIPRRFSRGSPQGIPRGITQEIAWGALKVMPHVVPALWPAK